jgi:hypothetical protein
MKRKHLVILAVLLAASALLVKMARAYGYNFSRAGACPEPLVFGGVGVGTRPATQGLPCPSFVACNLIKNPAKSGSKPTVVICYIRYLTLQLVLFYNNSELTSPGNHRTAQG